MKVDGKWIFLDNHSLNNLDKMYNWSKNNELIEIELGKINNEININDFKNNVLSSYIKNNHESCSTFCHFGIHRKFNSELIGYTDFQNIKKNNAEFSLSIADEMYRNKHYGIDAVITSLNYGFNIRNIENIIIRTRIDNSIVKNILIKLGLQFKIEQFTENDYNIEIAKYEMNKNTFEYLKNKL